MHVADHLLAGISLDVVDHHCRAGGAEISRRPQNGPDIRLRHDLIRVVHELAFALQPVQERSQIFEQRLLPSHHA
jgi:hypothetical protein